MNVSYTHTYEKQNYFEEEKKNNTRKKTKRKSTDTYYLRFHFCMHEITT
jgi:hypothetical protein